MFHGYWIYGLRFDLPKPKKLIFESLRVEKAVFMHILITESPILISFNPKTCFSIWEVRVKFRSYQIDDSCFDSPNPKNLVFESLQGEKVIFLCILIIGSPILIPFIPTTFFRCVGGVSHLSRLSDQRFAF